MDTSFAFQNQFSSWDKVTSKRIHAHYKSVWDWFCHPQCKSAGLDLPSTVPKRVSISSVINRALVPIQPSGNWMFFRLRHNEKNQEDILYWNEVVQYKSWVLKLEQKSKNGELAVAAAHALVIRGSFTMERCWQDQSQGLFLLQAASFSGISNPKWLCCHLGGKKRHKILTKVKL